MSESLLLSILYVLTAVRVVLHLQPAILGASSRRTVNELVDAIVSGGVWALLLVHFVMRPFYIPSPSMHPTLQENDFLLVNKLQYRITGPQRGEIAVFKSPNPTSPDKIDLIKRVVGIEGDVIAVKNGVLYRNGEQIDEPFIAEPIASDFADHRVPKGCCFMMGDNRNNSRDSRYIGDIPLANFVGRAEFIFYPFKRSTLLH